jgi:glycosyltransferase involved in cell wall biosynthesis
MLISIIIPAYNAEKYIKEAIDSIVNQTYKNLEIIVINDGSTDKTEETIKPCLSDSRIVYLKQENGGISKARNFGVKNSHGELVAFMDADDISALDRIEKQISFLEENPDYDIAYSGFLSFYDNGQPFNLKNTHFYSYKRNFFSGDIFKELLKYSFIKRSIPLIVPSKLNATSIAAWSRDISLSAKGKTISFCLYSSI